MDTSASMASLVTLTAEMMNGRTMGAAPATIMGKIPNGRLEVLYHVKCFLKKLTKNRPKKGASL